MFSVTADNLVLSSVESNAYENSFAHIIFTTVAEGCCHLYVNKFPLSGKLIGWTVLEVS